MNMKEEITLNKIEVIKLEEPNNIIQILFYNNDIIGSLQQEKEKLNEVFKLSKPATDVDKPYEKVAFIVSKKNYILFYY